MREVAWIQSRMQTGESKIQTILRALTFLMNGLCSDAATDEAKRRRRRPRLKNMCGLQTDICHALRERDGLSALSCECLSSSREISLLKVAPSWIFKCQCVFVPFSVVLDVASPVWKTSAPFSNISQLNLPPASILPRPQNAKKCQVWKMKRALLSDERGERNADSK